MEKAIDNLNRRGYDLPEETYQKLIDAICGFHKQLLSLESSVGEGPYVPFEHKVIPLRKV